MGRYLLGLKKIIIIKKKTRLPSPRVHLPHTVQYNFPPAGVTIEMKFMGFLSSTQLWCSLGTKPGTVFSCQLQHHTELGHCFIYITYGVFLHVLCGALSTHTQPLIRLLIDPRPSCLSQKLRALHDHFLILLVLD